MVSAVTDPVTENEFPRELAIAQAAAEELRSSGDVSLRYITAEFEPFSSGQRPDIVYIPNSGPNQDRIFIVELRTSRPRYRVDPDILEEHRNFATEDLGTEYAYFALATTSQVSIEHRAALAIRGISTFESIQSGKELARSIEAWSNVSEPPPWRSV